MTRNLLNVSNTEYLQIINEATESLKEKFLWSSIQDKPKIAVVLGSGLGAFADSLTDKKEVSYSDVLHMPESSVQGHAGKWVYGHCDETAILVAQGRFHAYEGYDLRSVTLPIRMMNEIGIKHVILTNAAGSVNPKYNPGDFMLIEDHLNLSGLSPLTAIKDEKFGPRFVDMSEPYCRTINNNLFEIWQKKYPGVPLHRGVYSFSTGPQYETPAEVQMAGRLGADAVGMSTIPTCIVAHQCGIKVNGITCITNYGSGIGKHALSHEEVSAMGKQRAPDFCKLVKEMIKLAI